MSVIALYNVEIQTAINELLPKTAMGAHEHLYSTFLDEIYNIQSHNI